MKFRKILPYLLVGIVIGFAICTLLGAIISHYDPDTLTEDPKIFGDAKIYAFTSDAVWGPDEEHNDVGKVLLMKRNDASLFYAQTDKSGKITNIVITSEDDSVRLSMRLNKSGKWRAIYCNDNSQIKITTGEQYIDLNFDGQFDVKALYNEDGERLSRHIYIGDGLWKEAQHIERQMAAVDEEFYVFSDDFGWQLSEP